ncbi:hypothetical protein M5K25_025061 [Dendrobium thyrsiflorum]|uniref:Uncharacterized protein n=1 Tax=Dendrobium thyrsiflorum TaxID=117978 RepID=A0ABD0U3C5_DENTH
MWILPMNEKFLVVLLSVFSSSDESTMEELHNALQAAIAHCKNFVQELVAGSEPSEEEDQERELAGIVCVHARARTTNPLMCSRVESSKERAVEELLYTPSNPPLEESLVQIPTASPCSRSTTLRFGRCTRRPKPSFWIIEEVDLSQDLCHWDQSLKSDECHFVAHVLCFFVVVDGIIIENLAGRIWTEVGLLDSKLADGMVLIRGVA